MTINEASERYSIPIPILREYESWGLCDTVKTVMCGWTVWTIFAIKSGKTPKKVLDLKFTSSCKMN